MGIIKAVYQIAYGSDMDKTFHYHIFVWGLILRLNSGDEYWNEGDSSSRMNGTAMRARHRRTMRSGMGGRRDEYELGDEGSDCALPNSVGGTVATAKFYPDGSGNRSGSEERILQGDPPVAVKGILKTMEFTVK
ncbi:hypothetical protein ColLi_13902 [Colletotrichum liriopes]|uniref:Uncharacterized protein n=1 Tax=Colletotrichum liriopes TaxID=708192 RepID=A0AA37H137_9PEZI|nr:hypothetical protein ColLi_13902 [Colletotrichum liriopes]